MAVPIRRLSTDPVAVLSVCGSLGATSANAAALRVASDVAEALGAQVTEVRDLARVPAFVPEAVDDAPEVVVALRSAFETADAVMIAAPEYAGGLCGSLKNALDWMVGSGSLDRRLVAVMSVGTTGGVFAVGQLGRTLSWQGARVVAQLGSDAPRTRMRDRSTFSDPQTLADIGAWAKRLVSLLAAPSQARRDALEAILTPYAIDLARFGEIE